MERRKFIIGTGALAAGGVAGLGTGAFSAMSADREADINVVADDAGLIALVPGHEYTGGSGTVSDAYVDMPEDELVIDLTGGEEVEGEGVNPDSTYQFGAIGDEGGDAIDEYVDGGNEYEPPRVTSDDVEYGEAAGGSTDATQDPAFVVTNQDTTGHEVELFYDGDGVEGATALLVGENGSYGATTFKVDPADDDDAGRMGAFPLDAGESLFISVLVVTNGAADTDDSFDGDIRIQAGEAEGDYE